jgi:hypothetical protein
MKLKHLYLILCVLGIALPYYVYMPYFFEFGFNLTDFIQTIFANPISSFIGYDLLIAALAVVVLIVAESRRLSIKHFWVPILAMIFIGTAFGFPLFLYLRELELEKKKYKYAITYK